jgi:subtilisin-like proprotein convertase family protein
VVAAAAIALALPAAASAFPCGYIDRTPDTPIAIPDGIALASASSSVYIPPGFFTKAPPLEDVDIGVDITHPNEHDLSISISHGGKTVVLSAANGSGSNYTHTTFDDEAATSITAATAPFTGSFKPQNPLSAFDGLDPTGVWTLNVRDGRGTLSGGPGDPPPPPQTLNEWRISWAAGDCPSAKPPCDEAGAEEDAAVPNGGSVTPSIQFAGSGLVTGVDARVSATHPDDSQVSFTLKHGATTVSLVNAGTATGANFDDTLFSGSAAVTIALGSAPYRGTLLPAQSLNFTAQSLSGNWSLTMADSGGPPTSTGTFDRFGVRVRLATCTDPDNDVVWSAMDNCPSNANVNQADHDSDGQGDVCDTDDDNDTVPDTTDQCPLGPVAFGPPPTDTDHDGCADTEDPDDDNDGVADTADACPLQTAAPGMDPDGDGCGNDIDPDDDNDGVLNAADKCPLGVPAAGVTVDATGCQATEDPDGDGVPQARDRCPFGTPGPGNDSDGDGCKDAEDPDDDDDGVLDPTDNCQLVANADQRDTDRDGQGDACDPDDDGDGLVDTADQCSLLKARTLSGCPTVNRKLTLRRSHGKLRGTLALTTKGTSPQCTTAQNVVLRRHARKGKDPTVGRTLKTSRSGAFTVSAHLRAGRYYVQIKANVVQDVAACGAATSKQVAVTR